MRFILLTFEVIVNIPRAAEVTRISIPLKPEKMKVTRERMIITKILR